MDPLYQRTFDQIRMSKEGTGRVRAELASRCAQRRSEVTMNNSTSKTRRPLAAIVAVCAVLALTVTAFASSGLAEHIFHMISSGPIAVSEDENGNVLVTGDFSEPTSPVELREDGRLYFTANGEDADITDLCSNETPYVRECVDAEGQRHLFIIGGERDAIGWAECMVDAEGGLSAFVLSLAPEAEGQPTPWRDAALAGLSVDTQVEIH